MFFTVWINELCRLLASLNLFFPLLAYQNSLLWKILHTEYIFILRETVQRSKGKIYFCVLTHAELFREHVGSNWRSVYFPHYMETGPDKRGFGVSLFLCHGAPLCTSAPIEGLHMYHQPCSMTNYICEMRLWGGLPSRSLLLGYVYRFQHEVLYYVSVWVYEREKGAS